jgi:dCMP deaminase
MMISPEKQLRWDLHFLSLAMSHARMSKDPSTRVGAIIVGPDLEIRSAGFNGFPRGVLDEELRLEQKHIKYKLMVHAELNAILAAARIGTPIKGCSLYVSAIDHEDTPWGGPPCIRCMVEIVQAGIVEVIGQPKNFIVPRWEEDQGFPGVVEIVMSEANITYREVGSI